MKLNGRNSLRPTQPRPHRRLAQPIVQLGSVSKHYEEAGQPLTVLENANAGFEAGQFIVLLGKSGSGKRTLFRRDRIGFVFQFFNLIPTLNVLENVLLSMELAGRTARQPARGPSCCWSASGWPAGWTPSPTEGAIASITERRIRVRSVPIEVDEE